MSLKKLLEIREKRKERVFLELSIASNLITTKRQALQKSKENLVYYREWRVKTQKTLFDELTSQQFKPKEYEKYLAKLTKIDMQERSYIEQRETAESLVHEAEKAYQQVKEKSLEVTRELEKLTEILKGSEADEKIMMQRKEENEAEEFLPSIKY